MNETARILVVEDTPETLELNAALLREAGYAVIKACSGAEALLRAAEFRPDLVLLDVVLPDLGGLEVARRLKADPDLGSTMVLLISSAEIASEKQAEGLETGADGYIARPVSNREMVARVEAMVRLKRVEDALRESRAAALASEARFRALMESAPDAMILVNRQGVLTLANQRSLELFGYTEGELIGQPIEILVPEIYRPQHVGLRDGFLAAPCRAVVGRDLAGRRKDGIEFFASISLSPIQGPEGISVLAAVRDVSERRRIEEALARRTRHLEAIRHVTEEIARELDLSRVLSLIIGRSIEMMGADSGMVRLWDDSQELLIPHSHVGMAPNRLFRLRLGEGVAGIAAQRRTGMVVNDFQTSSVVAPHIQRGSVVCATLAQPLLYRDRLVGVISIFRETPGHPFNEEDRDLLALFAAQAAIAIENARLHEASLQRALQLATLHDLSRSLNSLLDPGLASERILAAVQTLIPDCVGRLWQLAADGVSLQVIGNLGLRAPEGGWLFRFREGEGLVGIAAATREPVHSADVGQDPRFVDKAWAEAEGLVSCIVLPLLRGERTIGFLSIFTRVPHTFSEEEVSLLRSFTAHAAIALENARLHEATVRRSQQLARRTEQLEALRAVGAEITQELAPATLLELIVQRAVELTSSVSGTIYLWDAAAEALVPRIWQGLGEWMSDIRFGLGEGVPGTVAQRREGMIVNDYQASPYARSTFLEHTRVTAVAAEPLLYRDRLVGVISLNREEAGQSFSEEDRQLLALFAAQAAIAIENAQLHERLGHRLERLQALTRIAQLISFSLDLDTVLHEITETAGEFMGAKCVTFWVADEARQTLELRTASNEEVIDHPKRLLGYGEGGVGWIAEHRAVLNVPDRFADERFYGQEWARRHGFVSFFGVPVLMEASLLAVLALNGERPFILDTDDQSLLDSFVAQAAVAIQNARLYEEAQTQRARLKALFDSAVEGIYQSTPDGRFLAANPSLARIMGYDSPADLLTAAQDPARQLYVEPERRAEFVRQMDEHGELVGFESRVHRKDGSIIWVQENARTVRDGDRVLYYEGFLQDITARRQAEQMKSDFVSFATHQLRTPLAGIKWLLELAAQEASLPEGVRDFVQDAQASTERLIKLVNDLLNVTRLERGKIVVNPEAVDLAALTEEIVAELDPLIEDKGHRLAIDVAPGLPPVWGDRQLLRQVVLNLVSNAVKYTHPGGRITITARRIVDCRSQIADFPSPLPSPLRGEGQGEGVQSEISNLKSEMVEWSITDSGIGVPKAARARLFEKFYRADNVFAMETEGTGLGLYLVRLILEQSDGRIWCDSEEGQGATFTFRLPAAEVKNE